MRGVLIWYAYIFSLHANTIGSAKLYRAPDCRQTELSVLVFEVWYETVPFEGS